MSGAEPSKNEKLFALGAAMTACTGRLGSEVCPGLEGKRVENAPEKGIHPRGLFLWRNDGDVGSVEDVSVVVVSQNPGRADLFERWANRLLPRDHHRGRFEETSSLLAKECTRIPHYARLARLLQHLWSDLDRRTVLFAEVVYCQSAADKKPNRKTYAFCGAVHLEPQIELVGDGATVICAGAQVAKWFRSSKHAARFRWVQAEHPSGKSMEWPRLFAGDGLDPSVSARWQGVVSGSLPSGTKLLPD